MPWGLSTGPSPAVGRQGGGGRCQDWVWGRPGRFVLVGDYLSEIRRMVGGGVGAVGRGGKHLASGVVSAEPALFFAVHVP